MKYEQVLAHVHEIIRVYMVLYYNIIETLSLILHVSSVVPYILQLFFAGLHEACMNLYMYLVKRISLLC